MAEVRVTRRLLPSPTLDDPERKVYHVSYRAGELPPRFLVIPEKDWTKEKEAAMIKADMTARVQPEEETLTI